MFWVTVIFAKEIGWLYFGRVVGGLAGGGMYIAVPLLVAEISDDKWVKLMLSSMYQHLQFQCSWHTWFNAYGFRVFGYHDCLCGWSLHGI